MASSVSSFLGRLILRHFHGLLKLKVVRRCPCVFDMPFSLQTLSYNKYNLKPQTSEKQAKEILIRRQNTLRESMRKGHSLPWGKPVSGVCRIALGAGPAPHRASSSGDCQRQ